MDSNYNIIAVRWENPTQNGGRENSTSQIVQLQLKNRHGMVMWQKIQVMSDVFTEDGYFCYI